jgi:CubicO group peptidase (beta-lactamase class C family)
MKLSQFVGVLSGILLLVWFPCVLPAQSGPPQYERDAVNAVMAMLDSQGDEAIEAFIDQAMHLDEDSDRSNLILRLRAIREETRGFRDDVAVEGEPDGVRLILAFEGEEKQVKVVLGSEGITDLYLLKAAEPLVLTRENLAATFDRLETEGMSGVVYVRLGGEVVLERALGMANEGLGVPNSLNTVFGTGSRPIDYTMAAIYLLDQQGSISLDDQISGYFEDVPADKRTITIRHLMSGQSGLPDFFHTDDDWDPDLAWVDRETAERRILAQELLFPPGEGNRHSHGAFVLLAALIERVSGKTYYEFVRQNFFDPAGMARTGEYGESRGLSLRDFAVGSGPSFVGVPNIPPNWGPTSWLIKGSGGMYSTLGDLLKFYDFIRSGETLDAQHGAAFNSPMVQVDGSDRGFELFSAHNPPEAAVYLLINAQVNRKETRRLFRALERLVGFQ